MDGAMGVVMGDAGVPPAMEQLLVENRTHGGDMVRGDTPPDPMDPTVPCPPARRHGTSADPMDPLCPPSPPPQVFIESTLSQKVRLWFQVALARFPGASLVGKCDMDTYVSPFRLTIDLLRSGATEPPYAIYGAHIYGDACHWMDAEREETATTCLEEGCCCPPAGCTESDGYSDTCWSYAQGELLSMPYWDPSDHTITTRGPT